ncbi:hypothetical protein [Streptomyces sp. NPDC050388]|uniref:hypothetical protein n=1 Tax=Streptomyces sp. NPDC050388 TaxID=3155781 RepID=UPI0034373735
MADRRPLGTGPTRTTTEAELPPAPRAPLAAERLSATVPAATEPVPTPPHPAGRRTLGTGPSPPRVPGAPAAG